MTDEMKALDHAVGAIAAFDLLAAALMHDHPDLAAVAARFEQAAAIRHAALCDQDTVERTRGFQETREELLRRLRAGS